MIRFKIYFRSTVRSALKQGLNGLLLLCVAACLGGCFSSSSSETGMSSGRGEGAAETLSDLMFPLYGDSLVLPPNIAPLNFSVNEKIRLQVFCGEDKAPLLDKHFRSQVRFKQKVWKKWLALASERKAPLRLEISTGSRTFSPLHWFVADRPIDPYLVYRLVLPGDGVYNVLGIYQRSLADFEVKPLYLNTASDGNCMNCHTFRGGNADEMVVHWRFPSEGSLLKTPKGLRKIALPAEAAQIGLRLIYPAYHPSGRYIAFSTNLLIGVSGYEVHRRFFNSIDSLSRMVIYDIEQNRLFSAPALWQTDDEFTYPTWSPKGNRLYFCRAPKETVAAAGDLADGADAVSGASRRTSAADSGAMADAASSSGIPTRNQRIKHIRFDLVYIDFDPQTGRFGDSVHTLLSAADHDGSFALPRVNPAFENCIAVNLSPYSSFPARAYGDLGLVFLNEVVGNADSASATASLAATYAPATALNSPEAESFHSWSRSGHWMVYASKQQDGFFSLPYIAYFDGKKFSKPFLLPQKDGCFYRGFQKSFNLPEFTISPSKLTPKVVEKVRHSEPLIIDISEIEKLANKPR